MTQTTRPRVHDYLSTYCWHQNCGDCKQKCKTCERPCRCGCHRTEQTPATQTVDPAAAQPDGRMGGPTPHANHPADWYRSMGRGFALAHYGFPALPRRGERHAATDGSVWEFGLTGSDWWELAEYAPQQDSAARIVELEAALRTSRKMYSSARERAAALRPVAFVVVREEHGVMTDAQIFDSLTAANTAEGIASGYAAPGEKFTAYALTDIGEEQPNGE